MPRQHKRGDYYPAPHGNFRVNAKLFLKCHVVWGCVALMIESFFLQYPFNILTMGIAMGIAVDTWTHKYFH